VLEALLARRRTEKYHSEQLIAMFHTLPFSDSQFRNPISRANQLRGGAQPPGDLLFMSASKAFPPSNITLFPLFGFVLISSELNIIWEAWNRIPAQ